MRKLQRSLTQRLEMSDLGSLLVTGTRDPVNAARDAHDLGAVIEPIYTSTTFARDENHELHVRSRSGKSICYSRPDNPTVATCEEILCALEEGADCALVSSGMAAVNAVLEGVVGGGGDERCVLAPTRGYFAVRAFLKEWCSSRSVELIEYDPDYPYVAFGAENDFSFIDCPENTPKNGHHAGADIYNCMANAARDGKKISLIWIESPANPTWDIVDLERVVRTARELRHGCICVDSTVMTPCIVKPLTLGCDIVMHSATKYINGHGDVVAGALVTREKNENWRNILRVRQLGGAVLGSFDAYLLLRGMRTLDLRVRRQSETALWLAIDMIRSDTFAGFAVLYPGLASHPQHEVANRLFQEGLYGGMLSIVLLPHWLQEQWDAKGRRGRVGLNDLVAFCKLVATRSTVWTCATSLGGFESLIEHRYSVECAPGEQNPHVPAGLLRLSVGLENKEDLFDGLEKGVRVALDSI